MFNFHDPDHPQPCSECLLMQFVPKDRRETRFPCRHILLTSRGETVNSFYEWGTEEETGDRAARLAASHHCGAGRTGQFAVCLKKKFARS